MTHNNKGPHMLESFRARQLRVGVVGHIGTGRIRQVSGGVWMGQGLNHWMVTEAVKDPDGHNFAIDQPVMDRLGETRNVVVFAAFDSADHCSRIDRALFYRGARCCASLDGKTATWRYNEDDDGRQLIPFPESFEDLVVSRNGSSCEVRCQEDSCPLVTDPLWTESDRGKKTVWPCKPRGSFLFRIAAAQHSGIYVYKTTSIPTTEAVYAMLAYLERVTSGNMVQVPLSLVMTQAKPRYGRNVTRVNLQIACTLPEMIEHALTWKKQKHELDVDLDAGAVPAFEEADDDAADAEMFAAGDAEPQAPTEEPEGEAPPAEPESSHGRADNNEEEGPAGDAPKPYHMDVGHAMQAAIKASRWSRDEVAGMLQILDVERIRNAGPEKCQIMLEALAGAGPDWLRRYDKKGEVGQPALRTGATTAPPTNGRAAPDASHDEPDGPKRAQPSEPYHDDDIPF
jgi:hypothetical protein